MDFRNQTRVIELGGKPTGPSCQLLLENFSGISKSFIHAEVYYNEMWGLKLPQTVASQQLGEETGGRTKGTSGNAATPTASWHHLPIICMLQAMQLELRRLEFNLICWRQPLNRSKGSTFKAADMALNIYPCMCVYMNTYAQHYRQEYSSMFSLFYV